MPRNRKARGGTTTPRPHLQLPQGEERRTLTPEERREKLDLFLKDFDQEVENRLSNMRREGQRMIDSVERLYLVERMRIPTHILDMKMRDFQEQGGVIDKVSLVGSRQLAIDTISEKLHSLSTVKKDKESRALNTISEEGVDETGSLKRPLRKRKGREALAAIENTVTRPGTRNTRRTTTKKSGMTTPAANPSSLPSWSDTPMQTPAFNPRLPKTPSTAIRRRAKPGETFFSITGSPLANIENSHSSSEHSLQLGNDKVLCIPTDRPLDINSDVSTMSPLTEDAKKKLMLLQQNLADMIKLADLKK